MRNPGGYGVYIGADTGKREVDTFTCVHCNRIIQVKPMAPPEEFGGLCKVCMGLQCPTCVGKGCSPFEKKVEAYEKAQIDSRRTAEWFN
jgi:hypothetical protein